MSGPPESGSWAESLYPPLPHQAPRGAVERGLTPNESKPTLSAKTGHRGSLAERKTVGDPHAAPRQKPVSIPINHLVGENRRPPPTIHSRRSDQVGQLNSPQPMPRLGGPFLLPLSFGVAPFFRGGPFLLANQKWVSLISGVPDFGCLILGAFARWRPCKKFGCPAFSDREEQAGKRNR